METEGERNQRRNLWLLKTTLQLLVILQVQLRIWYFLQEAYCEHLSLSGAFLCAPVMLMACLSPPLTAQEKEHALGLEHTCSKALCKW